jgi:hypothetical protein
MFEPATRDGVVVPVPPFDTGSGEVIVMFGVAPPEDESGELAVTAVTPVATGDAQPTTPPVVVRT